MKDLKLTLIKVWFDMIQGGTKLEEYREIKWYWIRRFWDIARTDNLRIGINDQKTIVGEFQKGNTNINEYNITPVHYDTLMFYNGGYFSDTLPHIKFLLPTFEIGQGNTSWGAPSGENVIIIKWK